jgi:serine/threonine protein kinase
VLIVMEYVEGGSLDKYLQTHRRQVTEAQKIKMCLDVARGLEHIHAKGLVHRDIAARNCLYNGKNVREISQFIFF